MVASLAVREAGLALAEVVLVAVAVTGAGGVLKSCKMVHELKFVEGNLLVAFNKVINVVVNYLLLI